MSDGRQGVGRLQRIHAPAGICPSMGGRLIVLGGRESRPQGEGAEALRSR
ncbi:MAG: hypothetical protein LJE87_09230 [Deltaproteobacteria bacterium]|nr:hypothetical protein [Deltaproteobacteria bacterium]